MVLQNIIEPFNVDIIKVTIKDKPIICQLKSDESVKIIFKALKLYAQQEKKIREVKARITERILRRKLGCYFRNWYNYSKKIQKVDDNKTTEVKVSSEKRIESFVKAIAEKQKQIEKEANQKNEKCQSRSSESKSAPQQFNKTEANKQLRSVSGGTKTKQFLETPSLNRLEAQRLIIEEQKAKLAEQNKLIEEIKLNEISKEVKQTSKQTINAVKQVLNHCDEKTKRSLIHLMKEQGCRDKSLTEIARMPCSPEFVAQMEARAEARKQRLRQANEIRMRKREEERKNLEISRQYAEWKEQQEQIQAMKDAIRLRKEQEERRLRELEKSRKQELILEQYHKKYLFRRYILKPFAILMEEKNQRLEWARQHYQDTLLLKVYSAWKNEWIEQQNIKLTLARNLYRHTLLWYAFDDWKMFALDMKHKYQVAVDFYDMKLLGKSIRSWHLLYDKIKAEDHEKQIMAMKHYERYLKIIYFNMWKKYLTIADDIKEMEKRRDDWRKLIKRFMPQSYKPKNVSYNYKI